MSFIGEKHDHRRCVKSALAQAEQLCATRGARLTPIRRRVLQLVWASHKPSGAYEILEALSKDSRGKRVAPPTVYRALDFLLEQGLIHRIESLNAFVGCPHPDSEDHPSQFLICEDCGAIAELEDSTIEKALRQASRKQNFAIRRQTVELTGLCPDCGEARHG